MPLPNIIPLAGPLAISGFGLTFLAAGAVGLLLADRALREVARVPGGREPVAALAAGAPYLAVLAFLGARGLTQFANADWIWRQPSTWVHVDGHALSYLGALAGTAVGWVWLFRKGRIGWEIADALAGPAAAALAIGWLGMPGYGTATHLPWAVALDEHAGSHPIQLYGAFGFALFAGLLYWQWPRRDHSGQNVLTFAALTFALRLFLGFLVVAPAPWHGLTIPQAGDLLGLVLALAFTAWANRSRGLPTGMPS